MPNTEFNKDHRLSPALQVICGKPEMSRPQVISKLWKYIKAHRLQNPKEKIEILNDKKMQDVFKVKKMTMFQMNKLLSRELDGRARSTGSIRRSLKKNGNSMLRSLRKVVSSPTRLFALNSKKSKRRGPKKPPCKKYEPPRHNSYRRKGKKFCRKAL